MFNRCERMGRGRPARYCLAVAAALAVVTASSAPGEVPRTIWGSPDLQGTWDFRSITPFERPAEFKDKEFLTSEEVAHAQEPRGAPEPAAGRRAG